MKKLPLCMLISVSYPPHNKSGSCCMINTFSFTDVWANRPQTLLTVQELKFALKIIFESTLPAFTTGVSFRLGYCFAVFRWFFWTQDLCPTPIAFQNACAWGWVSGCSLFQQHPCLFLSYWRTPLSPPALLLSLLFLHSCMFPELFLVDHICFFSKLTVLLLTWKILVYKKQLTWKLIVYKNVSGKLQNCPKFEDIEA